MSIKNMDKKRAQFAYQCVKNAVKDEKNKINNYKSYVKKIPMMILNNGLASTFAFIYSKKESINTYGLIYDQTTEWLTNKEYKIEDNNLIEFIINQKTFQYRILTSEILVFFTWLKRFADGMIKDGENVK